MTVKEHYDNHLGNFYSWMCGDFEQKQKEFSQFLRNNHLTPKASKFAIDLGAGHGIHAKALAQSGFHVEAVDFNEQLLQELKQNAGNLPVNACAGNILDIKKYKEKSPEMVLCMGDTIAHLQSFTEIGQFINDIYEILTAKGKFIVSFRDYSTELKDEARFIHVKSDSERILTCFLEYFPEKIRVTDILYTKDNTEWKQTASSYFKVKITKDFMLSQLQKAGFTVISDSIENRMIHLVAEKQ
ncbi:MAG TPA: methyltransferase domain-containing protein [Bacteroidales bacterium]|nr:methyltransferase domain-containing protein [Bacteroidales bacterium]